MRHRLLAAAAAACLGAVACIGMAHAADATRGVTDSEITIGTYTDLSGVTAMWGVNNSNAIRMVFDEINAKGGINGRKIHYIVEDNQYNVPRSVQAANKLINRDNVFLLLANDGTPMNNAVLPEQLEKGVPNMFPLTSARSMYEPYNRLKFGLYASYYDQMRAGVKQVLENEHVKAPCALWQDTDFGRDVMAGVYAQLKAMNVSLVAEAAHKPTDTDFTASVARMRDAKCDFLFVASIVRDTNLIVSVARKGGWKVPMMGPASTYDVNVAEVPGNANEGFRAMTPALYVYPDDPRPDIQAFVKAYKAQFGHEPNWAAELGYSGAHLLAEGLGRAGKNLTLDSFITAMESIKDYHDMFGAPPVSFGPGIRVGSKKSYMVVVHNGRWEPVTKEPIGY